MSRPATPERVSEHVWRLRLPSRTLPPFDHVNVYLVAAGGVGVVVDPGSPGEASRDAIDAALASAGVRLLKAVLLTHGHVDHVEGLAALLESHPDCPVYLHALEAQRVRAAGRMFLADEHRLTVGDTVIRTLHTPGHSPGHLSFLVEDDRTALAGDLVAGQGSSWVGTPEGDVSAYLASLSRLRGLAPALLGPGHGPLVRDPAAKLAAAAEHRLARERQLLAALAEGPQRLAALRRQVYPGLPDAARELAERSLLAHLAKLMHEMRVVHLGDDPHSPFALRS